jgi:glycosyltransferase involved in cell wall biosynthesis
MKIALIILTRNERDCIEVVIPQVPVPGPSAGYDEMVVIDGASSDGTVEWFQEQGIKVVGQQSRRGRGHAFQIAFEEVEADAWIFFSPDGNEDPKDLPKFRPLLEAGNDIVIASRMMKGARNEEDEQFLKLRKWANNAFNFMANSAFRKNGNYISDSINGYRAITREAAGKLQLDAPDYTIEYQMTMRGFQHRLKIAEFPTHEGERVAGDTQAYAIPTGLRFVRAFWTELRRPKPPAQG